MELDYNSPLMQSIIEHNKTIIAEAITKATRPLKKTIVQLTFENEELKKEIARLKGETYGH